MKAKYNGTNDTYSLAGLTKSDMEDIKTAVLALSEDDLLESTDSNRLHRLWRDLHDNVERAERDFWQSRWNEIGVKDANTIKPADDSDEVRFIR